MEGETERNTCELQHDAKSDTFKKPQLCLVGPRKSKGSKVRIVDCQSERKPKEAKEQPPEAPEVSSPLRESTAESTEADKSHKQLPEPECKPLKPQKSSSTTPAQTLKETPIPYLEPKWGGVPPDEYRLDIIKSGTVLEPIDLSAKSYFVFGRQTNCDIQMAHPTVSRHHLVLQFSRGTDDKPEGFYLYDLGSTHGTFLNKCRVRPEIFIRVKVGHQIKLGNSTRLYLLQGPVEDMEAESDLTVTELKAKRQLELKARELAELNLKQKEEEDQRKREEAGIDWGMGDDADEETDLSENPYAITTNEELYIDDPKKTLRGWFEREGHELEYDVEEKGPGQFLCRVDVPVEGARGGCMVAEALVKGKKKEAVVQCALEACRLLDRLGLLRQATHESRKRKVKNWEEDDFYDSDEDTFLDRTGSVEKKRQQRMKQAGKGEKQVETYQSLSEKHSNVLETLDQTKVQLVKAEEDLAAAKLKDEGEGDTLDSFMSTLSKVGCADKKLISKLKVDLAALYKEEAQLRKLVNIAKPASLPVLVAPASVSEASASRDTNSLKNKLMLAARRKANQKQQVSSTSSNKDAVSSQEKPGDEEDKEEDDEVEQPMRIKKSSTGNENQIKQTQGVKEDTKASHLYEIKADKVISKDEVNLIGPSKLSFIQTSSATEETGTRKLNALVENVDADNDDNDDDESTSKEAERRKKKNRRRALLRNEKALERTKAQYDTSDPNYSVWMPPDDQSGDGTTKLNTKLGY